MAKMAPAARRTRARVSAAEAATGVANVSPQEVSTGGTIPAVGDGAGPGHTPPALTTVTISIMDTFIPTIPDVTTDKIERKMPYPTLTKFEDAPTYSTMRKIREEMFRNSIAVKSMFGGGKHGHYDSPQKSAAYLIEAGESWTVLKTGGVYPTFASGMTNKEKKREVAAFVLTEHTIKKAEVTQQL